jgi:Carboxypeptidase regulatory-like domain
MKKWSFKLAAISLISLGLCFAVVNARAKTGILKGRVTNAANGVPIRNLTIQVIGQGEKTTDDDGKYVFEHLPVGSYKVRIKSAQFDEHRRAVTIHSDQTTISNFRVLPLTTPRP